MKLSKLVIALFLITTGSLSSFAMEQKKIIKAIIKGKSPAYEEALSYIKENHPEDIPSLLRDEYLDDDDSLVRMRIIETLKLYPSTEIAGTWIEILSKTNNSKIEIDLLEYLHTEKIFTLHIADKLISPSTEVRQKAASLLKKEGNDRILPKLLILSKSQNPVERIYLLEALNYLYDVRFKNLVISFLNDENKSVRIYAIKCATENEIKESLTKIKQIAKSDENLEARKRAIEAIALFKDTQSAPILLSIIKEGNKELTLTSIQTLRILKISSAAATLSQMLETEKDDDIKKAILDSIITFGKSGNISGITFIAKSEKNFDIRIKAIYCLGVISEKEQAFNALIDCLNDNDYRIRAEACNSLGNLRHAQKSEILLNQLKNDSSRYVRTAALFSLQRIKNSKDIIHLFDIYSSEKDPVLRELLREYLREYIQKVSL